jgi:hypothetical protein
MKQDPAVQKRLIDIEHVDETVLALLWLGLHDNSGRTWKTHDWRALERLHAKGLISDPVGKAKSVVLTEAWRARSKALFEALFTKESEGEKAR